MCRVREARAVSCASVLVNCSVCPSRATCMQSVWKIANLAARWVVKGSPWINSLSLATAVVWLLTADSSRIGVQGLLDLCAAHDTNSRVSSLRIPVVGSLGLSVIAGISGIVLLSSLFVGPPARRTLRSWMLLSFLISGWLMLALNWTEVYWMGQGMRVSGAVSAAQAVTEQLTDNWPVDDGDHPVLRFVLAYPKRQPTTLILAGKPILLGRLRIGAIERSTDGRALRFQLTTPNDDTWLLYGAQSPSSLDFTSAAFHAQYTALRSRQLSKHWQLVRYRTVALDATRLLTHPW